MGQVGVGPLGALPGGALRRRPTPAELLLEGWDVAGTRALLRLARASAANSRWTRDDAAARIPEARAARVLYYGAPAAEPAAPPRGLPPRFVLCASRYAEYKGVDLLVFAWSLLEAQGLRIPLVLAGQDHSRGALGRFVRRLGLEGLVTQLGRVPHAALQGLMRRAEFLVLPSRRDSLGGVVLEAMAAGRPVVAARVGGVPELVRHGREGLLVAPNDPAALARAASTLWEDAPRRRRLAAGAERRSRNFSWARAAAELNGLAGTRPGGRVAVVVWDEGSDQTARAYRANALAGLRAAGARPYCADWNGLGRLERAKPEAWVVLLLRYRRVRRLARFFKARGLRPVVYLC
ncbi:glycosyltransferase family 1 protein [bacterium]|nr:MAG: glycosyltransferase family 1 protein [bacterium]